MATLVDALDCTDKHAILGVDDAPVSNRVCKPALTHEDASNIIREGRGQHFGPGVVNVSVEILEEFRASTARFSDRESVSSSA